MENESEPIDEPRESDIGEPGSGERRPSSLPLLLTLVSLLIWFGFQTVQLVGERNHLISLKTNFEGAVQEAEKMRRQLEALITKTAELAGQGNAAARAAIKELEMKGIPIQATPSPSK